MIPVSLQSSNLKLDGVVFAPSEKQEKNSTILFVHGWTSDKSRSYQYAEALTALGYICFLFDLRGHGKSEGSRDTASYQDFLNDVIAAYDFLLSIEGVDPENISAVGSSFGGYLLSILCSKRRIKNLVLRAPADYPNNLFNLPKSQRTGNDPDVVEWRKQPRAKHETFALDALCTFPGKVLIIESEHDDRVPHQTTENYMAALPDSSKVTHALMKGAPHSIKEGPFRDEVTSILVNWFGNRN